MAGKKRVAEIAEFEIDIRIFDTSIDRFQRNIFIATLVARLADTFRLSLRERTRRFFRAILSRKFAVQFSTREPPLVLPSPSLPLRSKLSRAHPSTEHDEDEDEDDSSPSPFLSHSRSLSPPVENSASLESAPH